MNDTKMHSVVVYGTSSKHWMSTALGSVLEFIDGGPARRRQYIHRVQLTGLLAGKKYCKFFYL